MNAHLTHILDNSTCLNRKQIISYSGGEMTLEERHAVEHHLNSCPFCSEALDGLLMNTHAATAINALNTDFLKAHFHATKPQIHLNSFAPAQMLPGKSKKTTHPVMATAIIFLLLAAAAMWYMHTEKNDMQGAWQKNVTPSPAKKTNLVAVTYHSVVRQAPVLPAKRNHMHHSYLSRKAQTFMLQQKKVKENIKTNQPQMHLSDSTVNG